MFKDHKAMHVQQAKVEDKDHWDLNWKEEVRRIKYEKRKAGAQLASIMVSDESDDETAKDDVYVMKWAMKQGSQYSLRTMFLNH